VGDSKGCVQKEEQVSLFVKNGKVSENRKEGKKRVL